jgi:Ca2+-binding EF-hand superfamily protein
MRSSTPRKSSTPLFHSSDPVQSPFPLSPLQTSSPSQPDYSKTNNHDELREVKTIFELFDPTLSGVLDVSTFESMMLSLGYRVDSHDILDIIKSILKDEHSSSKDIDDEFNGSIDLSLAKEILSKKGYTTKKRNLEDEALVYFRLFDVDGKGYITIDDLKRVMQCEATVQSEKEVTDDFCQAIIDKFDNSGDGTIVFDEFKRIVHPILA